METSCTNQVLRTLNQNMWWLLTVLLFGLLCAVFPQTGHALKPKFDHVSLSSQVAKVPVLEVLAEGNEWTEIRQSKLTLYLDYRVKMKRGKIQVIRASYGYWANFGYDPKLSAVHRDGGKSESGTFAITLDGHALAPVRTEALGLCNKLVSDPSTGNKTDRDYSTYISVPFDLWVRASRGRDEARKTVAGQVQVKVKCKKAPKKTWITDFRVEVEKSATCPKNATVYVGLKSTRNHRIRVSLTGSHMPTISKKVQPFGLGNSYVVSAKFEIKLDHRTTWLRLDLPNGMGSRTLETKKKLGGLKPITCPPVKVTLVTLRYDQGGGSSCPRQVWETAKFYTTRLGLIEYEIVEQDGRSVVRGTKQVKLHGDQYIAVVQRLISLDATNTQRMAKTKTGSNNSGWVPLKVACLEPLKGTLSYQDPKSPQCAREAEVAMAIRTTIPGKIRYRLQCSGKRNWSGKLVAQQTGSKTYLGVGRHTLRIKKAEHVNCALHTIVNGRSKLQTLRGYTFQCVGNTPTATDVAEPPRPTHNDPKPVRPTSVSPVPPRPVVDCKPGFRKVRNRCVRISCSRGETLVRNRCVQRVVECLRGFKKVGQRCVRITCPRGLRLVGHRCVRPTIECKRGFKRVGNRCARITCPRGQRLAGNRCERLPVQCARGFKKVGQRCVRVSCPRGQTLIRDRCVRRTIECRRGFRKVGQRCVRVDKGCSRGYRKFRGRCIKPAARRLNRSRRAIGQRRGKQRTLSRPRVRRITR